MARPQPQAFTISNLPPDGGTAIPTLYDETFRCVCHKMPQIQSMASLTCLVGYLEHHEATTDGSFAICVADGEGAFISQELFESIPLAHRPELHTDGRREVAFTILSRETGTAIGSTHLPTLFWNRTTGQKFRIKLFVYVMKDFGIPMFISHSDWIVRTSFEENPTFRFDFGHGVVAEVEGKSNYTYSSLGE